MGKNEERVHMFPESLLRPITLKGRSQDLKWWRSEPSNEKSAAPSLFGQVLERAYSETRRARDACYRAWCLTNRIDLLHIQPGRPIQNGRVESFNGKLRDEFST